MKAVIIEKLRAIEHQFDVKILYACESGSRAWGFASPDSDYDVRFIYVHKMDYYLSIDEKRDVIELPINDVLDINGWELRKALRLFRKSNAPLYEWLQSPIVYVEDQRLIPELREMMPVNFSLRAGMHHYLSMAKAVVESELADETVKLKRYFYALRPVLAAQWIANTMSVPPMDLGTLRRLMPHNLQAVVDELLSIKGAVDESFRIERSVGIDNFIKESIRCCETKVPIACERRDDAQVNEFFKKSIA